MKICQILKKLGITLGLVLGVTNFANSVEDPKYYKDESRGLILKFSEPLGNENDYKQVAMAISGGMDSNDKEWSFNSSSLSSKTVKCAHSTKANMELTVFASLQGEGLSFDDNLIKMIVKGEKERKWDFWTVYGYGFHKKNSNTYDLVWCYYGNYNSVSPK